MMKRLALVVSVLTVLSASVQAEDMWPAPWEGDPAYDQYAQTYQQWDFSYLLTGWPDGTPPDDPTYTPDHWNNYGDMREPYICWPCGPYDREDAGGNPRTVTAETLVEWTDYYPPGSEEGDPPIPTPTVHIGVYDDQGQPDTSVTVPVRIWIPNSQDDNLYKKIFWQMTSDKSPTPQANPPTTVPAGTTETVDNPQTWHGAGTWYTYSGMNVISPNPDGEWLEFGLVHCTNIEEIVIKTACVPEPATLGLLAAGGGLIYLMRRRRT